MGAVFFLALRTLHNKILGKVIAEIEKLQKLSNKKYYTCTTEQVNEMFGAIQTALDEAKVSFTSDTVEKKKMFTFSAQTMEGDYREYQNTDKHRNNVKEAENCSSSMSNNKEQSKGVIEITFSSTNQCQFVECLEKIIKEHCK